MNKIALIIVMASLNVWAFNTEYEKIAFGQATVIKAKKDNLNPEVLSLLVDVRSRNPEYPTVLNYTQPAHLCTYRQTLLAFAGYDIKTKEHIRTYEVQINVSANRRGGACSFVIRPQKNSSVKDSARVTVL